MIISRYLLRQVATTTLVVTSFLAFIMIGGRLIKYFGIAAQGRLDVSALLWLVAYRMPDFLTLILPLGFFTGLMLVFGRLYVDHEMAVLNASGVSRDSLALRLWPLAVLLIVVEAGLTLYAAPWGFQRSEKVLAEQSAKKGFDLVSPGRFMNSGSYTFYADGQSKDRTTLLNVFVHQDAANGSDVLIVAKEAVRLIDPSRLNTIVELHNGRRYELKAGQLKYSEAQFATYRLHLNDPQAAEAVAMSNESMSTEDLLARPKDAKAQSELGWRLTMPVMIILAVILSLPLSQVNPRQGRYLRLFPALLVFVALVIGVLALKLRIGKGTLSVWWYAGLVFFYLSFAMILARKQRLTARLSGKTPHHPHGGGGPTNMPHVGELS
ncbi:LPS export ABC transporter permease LptF [Aquirhabdus sp.]|uniref:LPS export ABC transporter permease LptF n=1 Tax=Aquirhabdus sp. TaxID=2824160 RepID=UPI00396C4500